MSQELIDLKTSIDQTAQRSLALFAVRWIIGFSIIAGITLYTNSYMWLWYVSIPIALLSLTFIILSKHLLTKQLTKASSAQETLASLLVPENEALRNMVVGTWMLDTVHEENHVVGETTYRADGTCESHGRIDSNGSETDFEVNGTWGIDGKNITWTIEESTNQRILPVGTTQREEILSITEAEKTYRDSDDNTWTEIKVQRTDNAQ